MITIMVGMLSCQEGKSTIIATTITITIPITIQSLAINTTTTVD